MPNPGMINWYEIYRNPKSQEGEALSTEHKAVLASKEATVHSTIQANNEVQLEDKPTLINTIGDRIDYHEIESNLTSKIQGGGDWQAMSMSIFCGTPGWY